MKMLINSESIGQMSRTQARARGWRRRRDATRVGECASGRGDGVWVAPDAIDATSRMGRRLEQIVESREY